MTSLAQRLEKLRSDMGLSRIELAAKLGLPRMSIEKFETGRITPTKEQQTKIAALFGVSVEYLRGESDEKGSMATWLSGNVPDDEPAPAPAPIRKKKPAAEKESTPESESLAALNLLLKSETFRKAVLEVMDSEEGRKLIAKAMKK